MTTITIDREVLEQAAALLNPDRSPSALFHQRRDCAEAIRAALSAPATTTPEPFAYTTGTYGGHFTLEPMNPAITIPKGFALYLHPPATAPAQPEIVDLLAEMYELILANKVVLAEKSGGVWTWPDRAIEAVRKHRSGPARAQADHKKSV
jgi:hypothetical protein